MRTCSNLILCMLIAFHSETLAEDESGLLDLVLDQGRLQLYPRQNLLLRR